MSEKYRPIQDQIKNNLRILLEYGVPLESIPYKKIWEKIDKEYSISISNEAADVVEKEKDKGKFGAFVVRRQIDQIGTDNVEVWSWSD